MMRHSTPNCRALTLLVASCSLAGCANMSEWGMVRQTPVVERVNETPTMSPAERERALTQAQAEGLQLAGEGRYGLALAAFEKAIELNPGSADTLFNIAACHEAMGDPMRAVTLYRQLLDVLPNDPDCYANLGTSYIKMYYRESSPVWRKMARKAWARSLELKADQADVRRFLAQTETLD